MPLAPPIVDSIDGLGLQGRRGAAGGKHVVGQQEPRHARTDRSRKADNAGRGAGPTTGLAVPLAPLAVVGGRERRVARLTTPARPPRPTYPPNHHPNRKHTHTNKPARPPAHSPTPPEEIWTMLRRLWGKSKGRKALGAAWGEGLWTHGRGAWGPPCRQVFVWLRVACLVITQGRSRA